MREDILKGWREIYESRPNLVYPRFELTTFYRNSGPDMGTVIVKFKTFLIKDGRAMFFVFETSYVGHLTEFRLKSCLRQFNIRAEEYLFNGIFSEETSIKIS